MALARSLVLEPDVLLLDEPLAALDPKLRKQMRVELKAMQRRVGITFLLVTHDQEEALSMSDQLAVMNAGRDRTGGLARRRLPAPAFAVRRRLSRRGELDRRGGRAPRSHAPGTCPADGGPQRYASGRVTGSVFLGDCVQVLVRLDTGENVVAQVPRAAAGFATGGPVHVCWDAADELVFE